jgi:biopolymer transport protein ExbD
MKQSQRAKRMVRHRGRLNFVPKLNLVPLIDCFVLLIFFLLINYSTDVEILQTDKTVKLPASISDTLPKENLVVMINATDILVSGRKVGTVAEMMATEAATFNPLEAELKYLASKAAPLTDKEKTEGRAITILGDRAIPYEQLKKIMASCVAAEYRNISLAVLHKEASNKTAGGPG